MVTGWSASLPSVPSAFGLPIISCLSALPLESTCRSTCMVSGMSGTGGVVVPWPSHVPARVLSLSKDFCASDFGALGWAGCLWASAWSRAIVESDNTARESIMRSDFILNLLKRLDICLLLYLTITLLLVSSGFLKIALSG